MKDTCGIVKDLLPLYHDDVCSSSSKILVEEHLEECDTCRSEMEKLNNDIFDLRIQKERNSVVEHHTQTVKKRSLTIGISASLVMAVPILVCLIVNLAVGHALDWFFIVLTAMMVVASITVVPFISAEQKTLRALGSFTGSLTLLLLTICLYVGGDWFFVAVVPSLFGLFVLFSPFIVNALPLKGFLSHHKGLLVMAADTVFLYGVVAISVMYHSGENLLRPAMMITTVSLLLPWISFVIIRYIRLNGFFRAGLCTIISGFFVSFLVNALNIIIYGIPYAGLTDADLFVWNQGTIDANVHLIISLFGLLTGGILLAAGFFKKKDLED